MFCDVLAGVRERFNWVIHAHCVMTDHYHLLVETPDGNLARG
jgi:putative transposase